MAVTCTLSTTITVSAVSVSGVGPSPPAVRAAAAEASSNRSMTSDLRCMYRLRLSGVQSNGFISVGAILIYEEARHIPSGST